jgi:hypothetical protein
MGILRNSSLHAGASCNVSPNLLVLELQIRVEQNGS